MGDFYVADEHIPPVNFAHDHERGTMNVPNRYSKVENHASIMLII